MKEEKYIKKLEFERIVLIVGVIIIWFIAYVTNMIVIRKYNEALIENARLEQQVIDYRWQLEQIQYVIEFKEN